METPALLSSCASVRTAEYWDTLFSDEDPWDYSTSAYERWKTKLTLELLPAGSIGLAMEAGCAEGHMTAQLAQRVCHLLALDISSRALDRARARCAGFDHVEFRQLDIVNGALPPQLDLILASEVLFYMSRDEVAQVAKQFAEHLQIGGHVLLAHGNVIQDDRTRTGFDWGHEFGAVTIGQIFGATEGLALIKELRTPLFSIQLYRRVGPGRRSLSPPQLEEIPLPRDLELLPKLEQTIIWDGAVMAREEAQRTESATAVPILMYHSIADAGPQELAAYRTRPAEFREQLRYLRRHGYHSISLREWVDCISTGRPVPGRPVIITFDDGYKDFIETALPELERSGFTATVFVVTEKVSGFADWDELPDAPPLMDWDDIRAAMARNVTIGSHSASHKDFLRLSPEEVRREGQRARAMLQQQLGHEVDLIAFPYGRSEPEGRGVLAECGYRIGVRTWGGMSKLTDDTLELSRIEINGTDDFETFVRKLKGEYVRPAPITETRKQPQMETPVSFSDPVALGEPISYAEPEVAAELEVIEFAPAAVTTFAPATVIEFTPAAVRELEPTTPSESPLPAPLPSILRSAEFSLHSDYRQQIAARFDALVGEFVRLQVQLLNDTRAPMTAQKRLASLFALPVTGRVARTIRPRQEIAPGVVCSFQETANISLLVEPKLDHSLSPESYLNTLRLDLAGQTEWLSIAVALEWREVSLARRFQLSFYANSNRSVKCEAGLRLPRFGNPAHETIFSTFILSNVARNAMTSGDLALPDFIKLDTTQTPQLVFYFDTNDDLSLEVNYLNCYFA